MASIEPHTKLLCPRYKRGSVTGKLIKDFKAKYPEYRFVIHGDITIILKTFHKHLVQGIIDNRDGIELPEGLGFLFIGNFDKAKKENIDYNKSRQEGRKILHQNWHSDNKLMKIIYSNSEVKYKLSNKQIWSFRLSTINRRIVSQGYRKQWSKYHMIPKVFYPSMLFKKNRIKDHKAKQRITPASVDYNEFKMD